MNLVPQTENVFPSLTVAENLHVGAITVPRAERRTEAARIIELFPLLAERRHQRAGSLSGGQRKLVALARALIARPRLLLLDEPSAGLSPKAAEELFATIVDLNRDGVAILMVEQNAMEALTISTRACVLVLGQVVRQGAASALMADPSVRDLFLGG